MKRKFIASNKSPLRQSRPHKLTKTHRRIGSPSTNDNIGQGVQSSEESQGQEPGEVQSDYANKDAPQPPPSSEVVVATDAEQGLQDAADGTSNLESNEAPVHNPEGPSLMDQDIPMGEDMATAQQQRDTVYLVFNGEDETDYTEGPARMVIASDGVKEACGSLLITLPLSQSIQTALLAGRAFAKMERVAERRREVLGKLIDDLTAEIANHNLRLLQGNAGDDESKQEELRTALNNLEQMLEENKLRQQRIQSDLEHRGRILRNVQREANEQLEAFVCAQLLEPEDEMPDTPIEDLDLQKEYQAFITPSDAASVVTITATPLDTSRKHMFVVRPEPAEEQKRKKEITEAVFGAQERLQAAQAAFDRREEDRANEWTANNEAAARGEDPMDSTPEDFDLRWVQRIQELTRELIEAESAFSVAKAAAIDGVINIAMDDSASGFVHDVADGYRMSMEQGMIDSAPVPKIDDWMSEIPDAASPSFNEQTHDDSEWQADEVQISDSVSMVAYDAGDRKRIDKWKRVCGLE